MSGDDPLEVEMARFFVVRALATLHAHNSLAFLNFCDLNLSVLIWHELQFEIVVNQTDSKKFSDSFLLLFIILILIIFWQTEGNTLDETGRRITHRLDRLWIDAFIQHVVMPFRCIVTTREVRVVGTTAAPVLSQELVLVFILVVEDADSDDGVVIPQIFFEGPPPVLSHTFYIWFIFKPFHIVLEKWLHPRPGSFLRLAAAVIDTVVALLALPDNRRLGCWHY